MKKATLWILLLAGAAPAWSAEDGVFEHVSSEAYKAMLRDATAAYDRKDFAKAFELNRRAACAGDKTSQAILGRMVMLGQGTARDQIAGYAWIKLAAEFNYADFTSLARKLEDAMMPQQREQGAARVEELRKSYGIAATNMSCRAEPVHGVYIIGGVGCTPASAGGGTVLLHRCEEAPRK